MLTLRTSELFPPNFTALFKQILHHDYTEYTLCGGRGSCKSSFISIVIIILMFLFPSMSVVVVRKHENTLRDSVFAQMQWAIDKLHLNGAFRCTVSPMQITRIKTGQKIFFRGCDDPVKIKSIKVVLGYIGILWFEESCELTPEEMRSVKQSVERGGDKFWIFESFNPPVSLKNWKNADLTTVKENRIVHRSDYRTVPEAWLSEAFIFEAEHLKKTNPRMYVNEYLGEATGTGENIFENIELREITDDEIKTFEWIYNGLDWGYYPDPLAYIRMAYDAGKNTLYIYLEDYMKKLGNWQASEKLKADGIEQSDYIIADSAEPKSINDFKQWGWNINGAVKGPGSLESGFKWLQSLDKIVIDDTRCPACAAEFTDYEYDKDKDGNVLSGYPQGQADHGMAAVRYAMEPVWRRSGM